MKLGYARVSTEDQHLSVQLAELKRAGCESVYREKLSGTISKRPQLEKLLAELMPGDVLVCCRLDRLARSTVDLLGLVERISHLGGSFLSLGEPWADTTSPAGKLVMTVFAGVAQFERERMLERCEAGRQAAKTRGVRFGRKPALTEHQQTEAKRMLQNQPATVVAATLGVSERTIYRLKRANG